MLRSKAPACLGQREHGGGREAWHVRSASMTEPTGTWVKRRPAPALRRFVEAYVGYRLSGFAAGEHRGLPSRHLTLIVSIGPGIDVVAQTDARQSPRQYRCVVGGLQASPALIAHGGHQEGVAIELTPLGSRALLGMPARALWNMSLELDEVTRPLGSELWERVQELPGWPDRFAAVDEVLGGLLREDAPEPALQRSWQLVTASAGKASVAHIADTLGWTRQHFARRFADEFGLSPKLAVRVVRFDRARRMLQATPSFVSLAQVAAVCGYYDQAHMTRDFVEFAGCPPARLLADEDLPFFQDTEAGEPGSSSP
jgi:AraC-like DNA-binding protein